MTVDYVLRRLALFLAVVFIAATLNFFFLRAGLRPGGESVRFPRVYAEKYGGDVSLWRQYANFLGDTARLDFGKSVSNYPTPVIQMLKSAIPWSVALLGTATLMSFILGNLGGALLGWGKAPRWLRAVFPVFFTFSAVPFYLMGLILLYVFAFKLSWLPIFGGYDVLIAPEFTFAFWLDVLKHALLPAASLVLTQIGFWMLGMRSMIVMTSGEAFMQQAESKGLRQSRMFFRYALRNSLLPQSTQLAVTLGHVISGAILVELVFSYPGVGRVLYDAIIAFDFFVIQGVIFMIIVTVALAMLIIDLIYPLLDPRVTYKRT
ncbi:ABC transporter permease [Dehalococcoides mccartyi]|nr:ABC transporter permease [Dehalococcoides mccartyi]